MYAETGLLLLPLLQGLPQELHLQQHPLQEELLHRLQSSNVPLFLHDGARSNMVQATTVTDYDLDIQLFKAPELIVEDPVIEFDSMAAAVSLVSNSDDVIDSEIMKIADIDPIPCEQLLSEAFYKSENILDNPIIDETFSEDLLKNSTIDEALSEFSAVNNPIMQNEEGKITNSSKEVQDKEEQNGVASGSGTSLENDLSYVKISALQIEEKLVRHAEKVGDETLQESVSSSSLTSLDWTNGGYMKANFLDFQGVHLSEIFGMRRAYSEGDIQNLGNGSVSHANANIIHPSFERLLTVDDYKAEERREKLSRYRNKKTKRNFKREIKYACRKALADSQPRVRGRFAKSEECVVAKSSK